MSADGKWNMTMKTPMGEQNGTLDLKTDGGTLTGEMSGATGTAAVENGTVDGNALAWSAKITSPMPMTLEFKGTVDGDTLTGEVKLGAFGNAPFTGTRG
ncbi:MAG: hypothetical protein EVA70_07600 [Parvularculaceae bacterium]|nr:MAG: hypothetical protein EVA70_07600 [Parvularculaceae bacterium]